MATADVIQERDEQEQEHLGGGRFNRLLGVVFVAVAMVGGVALALGVQSSGRRSNFRFPEISGRPRLGSPRPAKSRTSQRMAQCPTRHRP